MEDPLHDPATDKEFGPQTSLRKRRLWGVFLIVVVLAFIGFAVNMGEPTGNAYFGENEAPMPWWVFALLAGLLLAVGVGGAAYIERYVDKTTD